MADLPKLGAFVVFNSTKDMVKCYRSYHESKSDFVLHQMQSLAGSKGQDYKKLTTESGNHKIKVEYADAPSNILW